MELFDNNLTYNKMRHFRKSIFLLSVIILLSCGDDPVSKNHSAQVETLEVEQISDITAVCKGKITDKGTGTISQYGIELDDGTGYEKHPRTISSGDHFGVEFVGLIPDKTYRYRAYVDDGTVQYGEEKSFTTLSAFVYTATVDPESITSNSAVVSFSGINKLKEWGFHYSETEATVSDPVKKEFLKGDVSLANLKPNTTYYILPYVIDKSGKTTYLEITHFKTAKGIYSNPVVLSDAPDPTIIRAQDGNFYLYSTGVGIHRSADLVKWIRVGEAFTEVGKPKWEPGGGLWAPDINYIDGQYVMYYSMSVWGGTQTCGIGVATSDKPEGPFTDRGKLFRSNEIGVENSIDPFYIEDNGKKYLFWGSWFGIHGTELTDDGLALKEGAEKQKIGGTAYEASYIHKRGKYYYLFTSMGSCCEELKSTYTTVVGRSENLWGPYVNKSGGRMLDNKHEIVIQGNAFFKGPGHNSEIITDKDGDDWIFYHAWEVANPSRGRQALMDKIIWENDWPVIKNKTPSSTSEAPVF